MTEKRKSSARQRASSKAEPWEVEFAHSELPTHSYDEVEKAVGECKTELADTPDRKNVLKCVRRKFS
jgi:hypothetical protein